MTDVIDAQISEMKAAWAAKDVEKVLSFYSDDACYGTNAGDIVKGKDKFRSIIAAYIEKYSDCDFAHASRSSCEEGGKHSLLEMGTFICTVRGTDTRDKGKYMARFENRDGKWICNYDLSVFC